MSQADLISMSEHVQWRVVALGTASGWNQDDFDSDVASHLLDMKAQHVTFTRQLQAHRRSMMSLFWPDVVFARQNASTAFSAVPFYW